MPAFLNLQCRVREILLQLLKIRPLLYPVIQGFDGHVASITVFGPIGNRKATFPQNTVNNLLSVL